ncbi:MAG: hypothetical protein ABJE47_07530 [bacterium]
MTKLSIDGLAGIQGGDLTSDIDAFCAGVALGALFNPVAAALPGAFCVGWGIGRLF